MSSLPASQLGVWNDRAMSHGLAQYVGAVRLAAGAASAGALSRDELEQLWEGTIFAPGNQSVQEELGKWVYRLVESGQTAGHEALINLIASPESADRRRCASELVELLLGSEATTRVPLRSWILQLEYNVLMVEDDALSGASWASVIRCLLPNSRIWIVRPPDLQSNAPWDFLYSWNGEKWREVPVTDQKFDWIWLDLQWKDDTPLRGLEMLGSLRKQYPGAAVMVATAHLDPVVVETCAMHGVEAVYFKHRYLQSNPDAYFNDFLAGLGRIVRKFAIASLRQLPGKFNAPPSLDHKPMEEKNTAKLVSKLDTVIHGFDIAWGINNTLAAGQLGIAIDAMSYGNKRLGTFPACVYCDIGALMRNATAHWQGQWNGTRPLMLSSVDLVLMATFCDRVGWRKATLREGEQAYYNFDIGGASFDRRGRAGWAYCLEECLEGGGQLSEPEQYWVNHVLGCFRGVGDLPPVGQLLDLLTRRLWFLGVDTNHFSQVARLIGRDCLGAKSMERNIVLSKSSSCIERGSYTVVNQPPSEVEFAVPAFYLGMGVLWEHPAIVNLRMEDSFLVAALGIRILVWGVDGGWELLEKQARIASRMTGKESVI